MATLDTEDVEAPTVGAFGVEEGMEIMLGTPGWEESSVPVGCILEACLAGSSIGLGGAPEEWFAIKVIQVEGNLLSGRELTGEFLGYESDDYRDEVADHVKDGIVHLCPSESCPLETDTPVLHVTRFRLWTPSKFVADYLTRAGQKILKDAIALAKKMAVKPKQRVTRTKKVTEKAAPEKDKAPRQSRRLAPAAPGKRPKEKEPVIPVLSDGEEEPEDPPGGGTISGPERLKLREMLRATRERILSGGERKARTRVPRDDEDVSGGHAAAGLGRAAALSNLVAGTNLNPRRSTPLQVAAVEDIRDSNTKTLKKKMSGLGDAASSLLAQAVQQSTHDAKKRKRHKKDQEKNDTVKQLVRLLKGGKDKKEKKRQRKKRRQGQGIKPDPDGSGGGDSSSQYGTGSSSAESQGEQEDSEADSDLSLEAPLRKRATKQPGSVLSMLVRHAQDQLDRGSLLESEGTRPFMTSGIKISTYFALLIRPYYQAGSPLLREMYALAAAIDLLRNGKLPETGDALAARFIAVHTALSEGHWNTASHLELFPMDNIASATTSTLLEAHKHRRTVLKSQGYGGGTRWWGSPGKGKGGTVREGEEGRCKRPRKEQGQGSAEGRQLTWEGRCQHLEGKQGGPREEGLTEEQQVSLDACYGLIAGLAEAAPWPSELGEGLRIFRRLAGKCTDFECAGRALTWVFFNFPRFDEVPMSGP